MEKYKTKIIGQGEKTIAVVACLHGDEIVGKHIHNWLIQNKDSLKCKAKLIFGNPIAHIKDTRFVHENLNRVFPGKEEGNYEERQAFRIMQELKDVDMVLDIHSTTLDIDPFAICVFGKDEKDMIKSTGLKNVMVYTPGKSYKGQTLCQAINVPAIAFECGQHKKPETLENGIRIIKNIFRHYNFLDGNPEYIEQNFFKTEGTIIESEKDMILPESIRDFQIIEKNTIIAEGNNSKILSEDSFYPILISKNLDRRENGVLMLKSRKINYSRGKIIE